MPAAIIAAGAVGSIAGGVGQYFAGKDAANASQGIADAQLKAAKDAQQLALGKAAPTALELGNMNSQLQQAGQALQRQQKLFDSVDPALLESGKQALELMQGKSAASVDPMLKQRAQERTQMLQQLQQQLGPGAASSSAGAQALANFDLQTSNYQAGLQQQALGTMLGQTTATAQLGAESGSQAAGLFGQVGQQSGNIQNRQVNAALGSSAAMINSAGAPFAGDLANAKNMGSLFGSIGTLGGQAMGGGMGMMGGTPKPTTTDTQYGLGK